MQRLAPAASREGRGAIRRVIRRTLATSPGPPVFGAGADGYTSYA